MPADPAACPHCGAPRVPGNDCPRCGVIYARAEARVAAVPTPEVDAAPPPPSAWTGEIDDARTEYRLRLVAVPLTLLLAGLAVQLGFFHMLIRMFLTMWVHETGHAVTAWFCGLRAFPMPWKTPISEERQPILAALAALALVAGGVWLWLRGRRVWAAVCGALLLLQASGTLGLSLKEAHAIVIFGGDAGAMVLGTLLMTTVYAKRGGQIQTGWLRWGFLVIGACSFADVFDTWWAARTNFDRIPFGEIEGVGLSDPSKLTETYDWTYHEVIHRYVVLGIFCLVALAGVYAYGLWQARREIGESGG